MTPSVRSRMWASGTAFGLGFVLANYGILMVPRTDQIVWLIAAGVMMLTGALGVLFADSPGRLSVWATLGLELLVGFTLLPLGWLISLAIQPATSNPTALMPQDSTGEYVWEVFRSDIFRQAALDTFIVAIVTSLVSVVLGASAAYALARMPFRGRRTVYAITLACMFLPLITIVGPLADQSLVLGLYDTRWALLFAYLALTLPLATWLLTRLFQHVPWQLRDAARADGATWSQLVRRMWLPVIGPGFLTVLLLVFFAAWNFLLFGLGLSATGASQTLPAALTQVGDEFDNASAAMAAASILWLLPVLLFILVFQRRIVAILAKEKA